MLVKTHQPAFILTVPKSSNPHSSIPLQFLLKHACNLKVCAFIIVQFLGKNSENLRWIRNSPARPELLGLWVFLLSWSLSLPSFLVSELCCTLRWVRQSPVFLESCDLSVSRLSCAWALLHSEVEHVTYTQQCELCLLEMQIFLITVETDRFCIY